MNRKIAAAVIMLLLGGLYALRATPIVFMIACVGLTVAGSAGYRLWPDQPRRWLQVKIAVGLLWIIIRSVLSGGPRALFLGEAMLLAMSLEFIRVRDWKDSPAGIPGMGVVALLCAMQQRVLFAELGLFTLLGILVVIAIGWFSTQARVGPKMGFARKRISVAVAILGVSAFASFKVSEVWGEQISVIENRVDILLSGLAPETTLLPYPRSGNLNSITLEKGRDPDALAIKVYSKRPPGYMVGRVFDVFNTRAWILYAPRFRSERDLSRLIRRKPSDKSGIRVPQGENIFSLSKDEASKGYETFEITNTKGRGNMLFVPLGTRYLRGYGQTLMCDSHGVVHSGITTDAKYYAYVDSAGEPEPLDDELRKLLLHIHRSLREEFNRLGKQLGGDRTTFAEKVQAVETFLATDSAYSLNTDRNKPANDLIREFLVSKEGHCELFATTTALLLRAMNIPTRYVTGYVCQDRDPDDDDYWAALNRDAHAWVEAWDAEEGKWVLVETTPGMSVAADTLTRQSEGDATLEEDALVESESSSGMLDIRPWLRAIQWGGLIVTLLLLAWTWIKFSDRDKGPRVANAKLLKLDKRLAKCGIVRTDGETLNEFADRVEAAPDVPERLRTGAAFYRDYAHLLYGGYDSELQQLALPASI